MAILNKLISILKKTVDDEILSTIGFSDYDDEHCTWGNRRLHLGNKSHWYTLQIIENGDFPEEGYEEGFVYSGWFEIGDKNKTKDGWDLLTVRDIYKIIYLYHREWLPEFKQKLLRLKFKNKVKKPDVRSITKKQKPKRSEIKHIKLPSDFRNNLRDFPRSYSQNVRRVIINGYMDNVMGYTTTANVKLREITAARNPKLFPWETKYNSIPQSVHDAYSVAKGVELFASFKDITPEASDGKTGHGDILEQIQKNGKQHVYGSKPFALDDILDFVDIFQKQSDEKQEIEQIQREKDIALWDKYYGKYNLEWRDWIK